MVASKHFTLGTVVLLKVGKILILDKTLLDLYKGQHTAPGFSVRPTLDSRDVIFYGESNQFGPKYCGSVQQFL